MPNATTNPSHSEPTAANVHVACKENLLVTGPRNPSSKLVVPSLALLTNLITNGLMQPRPPMYLGGTQCRLNSQPSSRSSRWED